MSLWGVVQRVRAGGARRLAVVGMAKNAGKTTVLNYLIGKAAAGLGLVSTGRDGESRDAVTELPKPSILAPAGTLLATGRQALDQGSARLEVIEDIGSLVLARVREPGTVLLTGPGSVSGLRAALARLEFHGAGLSLVDGSLNRLASASPVVTDAVILATGAALSRDPVEVLRLTRCQAEIFSIPRLPDSPVRQMAEVFLETTAASGPTAVGGPAAAAIDSGGTPEEPRFKLRALDVETALGLGARLIEEAREARIIVFRGALPATLLAAANLRPEIVRCLHLIVPDPTHVFADPLVWRRFERLGGRVWVLREIRLLAVTLNPWSPSGPGFDPAGFLARGRAEMAPFPVYDVQLEGDFA